jgi:4-alpha-glucanotransferase
VTTDRAPINGARTGVDSTEHQWSPPRRTTSICLSVFLNTLRTKASWGVGDFGDLAQAALDLRSVGVDLLLVGPIGATSLAGPIPASPYSPESRAFRSLLHLHVPAVRGWESLPLRERRSLVAEGERLNTRTIVDLAASRDLKLRAMRGIWEAAGPEDSHAPRDADTVSLALYFAAQRDLGADWRRWPHGLRQGRAAVPSSWIARYAEDIEFLVWCQREVERQFRRACGAGVPLVVDLPVGTPISSFDTWDRPDAYLAGRELGSPPDYFNPAGHRWGLAVVDPSRLDQEDPWPLARSIRATLRGTVGLRIDHAYGLIRQCTYVAGEIGDYGWVKQPGWLPSAVADLAQGRLVITEELGTPPPGSTKQFRALGFHAHVPFISDQFDAGNPPAVLSLSCHDLPTVAACLTGRSDGPVLDRAYFARARSRLSSLTADGPGVTLEAMVRDAYTRLVHARPQIAIVQPEDALLSRRPVNLPGVAESRWPSFSHRLPDLDIVVGCVERLVHAVRDRAVVAR